MDTIQCHVEERGFPALLRGPEFHGFPLRQNNMACYNGGMFTVFIEGLEFYGYHGVPAEERILGHRYMVDLWLTVASEADASDRIEETVDYGEVGVRVIELATRLKAHTLEHLAGSVCEELLAGYPAVSEVKIRVSKPHPPTPIIAARAGVEMVRKR